MTDVLVIHSCDYLRGFVPDGNVGLLQYSRTDSHAKRGLLPHKNGLSYKYLSGFGNTRHFRLFGFDWILQPFHIIEIPDSVKLGIAGFDLHSMQGFLFVLDDAV